MLLVSISCWPHGLTDISRKRELFSHYKDNIFFFKASTDKLGTKTPGTHTTAQKYGVGRIDFKRKIIIRNVTWVCDFMLALRNKYSSICTSAKLLIKLTVQQEFFSGD